MMTLTVLLALMMAIDENSRNCKKVLKAAASGRYSVPLQRRLVGVSGAIEKTC